MGIVISDLKDKKNFGTFYEKKNTKMKTKRILDRKSN